MTQNSLVEIITELLLVVTNNNNNNSNNNNQQIVACEQLFTGTSYKEYEKQITKHLYKLFPICCRCPTSQVVNVPNKRRRIIIIIITI